MNVYKKWVEILKANYGSTLSYDFDSNEWVITFKGKNGFRIPGDCAFDGRYILKENSNKVVCRVKLE